MEYPNCCMYNECSNTIGSCCWSAMPLFSRFSCFDEAILAAIQRKINPKSVRICVNSSCVHVNLYVHVMVFGLFVSVCVCTCHVWKRRESNRQKIEYIVCSLCMPRHEISFDEWVVMATRSIASRSLFCFTYIRERVQGPFKWTKHFSRSFSRCIRMQKCFFGCLLQRILFCSSP